MDIVEHVKSRNMDLNQHDVWFDKDNCLATFPLWSLTGQMSGFQQYNPLAESKKVKNNAREGKYFTYRNKGIESVWGMESWDNSFPLFAFEGVFDAAPATKLGYSAVATIFNDPNQSMVEFFYLLRQKRPVIAICDEGKAGRKLAKIAHIPFYMLRHDTDFGDLPLNEAKFILDELTESCSNWFSDKRITK